MDRRSAFFTVRGPDVLIKIRRNISDDIDASNQLGGVVIISCARTGVTTIKDDSLS